MAITREVVQEKSAGITPSGKQVVKQKTQYSSPEAEEMQAAFTVTNLINYITGGVEALLILRFIFRALGANPGSWFVNLIYTLSSPLEFPFRNIFSPAVNQGIETRSVLEPSTLVAILIYALLSLGIAELVRVLTARREE